jgi:gamma-glutamyltranspeptidase
LNEERFSNRIRLLTGTLSDQPEKSLFRPPRVHHQWLPNELRVERGLSVDTIRLLQGRGHKVEVRQAMGSTHSILRTAQGFDGASDQRQAGTLAAGVR